MKFKIIVPLLFLVLVNINIVFCKTSIEADTIKPEIGKPMPDFMLDNVHHYKSGRVSPNDFKGRWLFMDFWFMGCSVCIKSFPKVNAFQEKFKDQIQFLLVGANGSQFSGKRIELLYEKLRQKQNLKLAIAYDSILNMQWNIWMMPHIIIVDPEGIVRAITDGRDMNDEKIQKLIDLKDVSFYPAGGYDVPDFDGAKVTESHDQIVYRSVLSRWNNERQEVPSISAYISYSKRPCFKVSGVPLFWLYNLAYFGKDSWQNRQDSLYDKVYPYPVLEIQDTSLFTIDFLDRIGIYNYELIIPHFKNNLEKIMTMMQSDLRNIFGYEVSIENRLVTVWKLVTKQDARERLKNKGLPTEWRGLGDGVNGFEFRNFPVKFLLDKITRYISDNEPPFFDETGITENIDIVMNALLTDREQIIKALNRNGLDLVKGKRLMKVLVIKDHKQL